MRATKRIITQAIALVPKYEKAVSKKMNANSIDDTLDIETLFADENLGAKLVGEFETARKESIVPAALCWLFFGRSFENMVERGEEIMNNPNISRLQSFVVARTTKLLIKRSIALGLRTREDWDEYNSLKKVIDSGDVMDWALAADEQSGEQPDEKRKPGRPSTAGTLVEMFASVVRNKKKLTEKIGEYLTTKHSQTDIARLKIALDELHFLVSPVGIKSFRDALAEQYAPGIHIVHERGIQDAYSRLTSTVTIKDVKVMVADRKEDRPAIDELKEFLRR